MTLSQRPRGIFSPEINRSERKISEQQVLIPVLLRPHRTRPVTIRKNNIIPPRMDRLWRRNLSRGPKTAQRSKLAHRGSCISPPREIVGEWNNLFAHATSSMERATRSSLRSRALDVHAELAQYGENAAVVAKHVGGHPPGGSVGDWMAAIVPSWVRPRSEESRVVYRSCVASRWCCSSPIVNRGRSYECDGKLSTTNHNVVRLDH